MMLLFTDKLLMPEESPQKSEEKDAKAPWNLQLADIITQAVAGGSIGMFATLLNSSDLPKLALGGVIGGSVAPIVLAIAEPISKRLKKGAGYLGEAAASGTEDAAQKWWTGLSGVTVPEA